MNLFELESGNRVSGEFLLADAKKGVKEGGAAYWSLVLQDCSGTMDAKKWDYRPEEEAFLVRGNVVHIEGEVLKYRNALQMKVYSAEMVDQEKVDWSRFVASAPMSIDEMEKKLELLLSEIKDDDIRLLTKAMVEDFKEKFLSYPGAVRNHHDFYHGLLFHSLTMADLGVSVCRIYPSINRDLIIAGVLIHDLGKTIELSGVRATSFTLEGKLLGHISIGHAELRAKAKELGFYAIDSYSEEEKPNHPDLAKKKEVAVLLEHIVLSHHSKPEFGSPTMPATREALVVAMVDDLDAKMHILDKALLGVEPGGVTAKLFNMDDRYFYKPTFKGGIEDTGLSYQDLLEILKK